MQSSEADEKVYHELLVHPAMLHHPNPRRIFICGGACRPVHGGYCHLIQHKTGGEGSTARELLRYPGVEEVVMVDIDAMVCNFCKQHLEVVWESMNVH